MKLWLRLLTGFLIIVNLLAVYYLDGYVDKWFRFGATFIFLVIYIFKYFSRNRLLLVFLFITICDGLLVYYEEPLLKKIIYTVRILAYLNLILLILPSLKKLKFNLFSIIVTIFVLCIDLYLLHDMAETLPSQDQNIVFLILFYLLGIISLVLVMVSISYLNRYADRKSLFLVIVSFGFVLSDIFFYNAYYLEFSEFRYLDRFSNILGLAFLLAFCRNQKSKLRDSIKH